MNIKIVPIILMISAFGIGGFYWLSQEGSIGNLSSTKKVDGENKTGLPPKVIEQGGVKSKTVSAAELKILTGWMKNRGFNYDAYLSGNGEPEGKNAFSGYDAMEEQVLRRLATQGDPRAAMTLARQILVTMNEGKLPEVAKLAEAKSLLNDATVRGYTASIQELAEVNFLEAERVGRERKKGDSPYERSSLIEAYKYAYLLEKRGNSVPGSMLQVFEATARLSDDEKKIAEYGAQTIYSEMNRKRQELGLPPFDDTVPPEIIEINRKLLVPQGFKVPQ